MLKVKQFRELFNIILVIGTWWIVLYTLLMTKNQAKYKQGNGNFLHEVSKFYADRREELVRNDQPLKKQNSVDQKEYILGNLSAAHSHFRGTSKSRVKSLLYEQRHPIINMSEVFKQSNPPENPSGCLPNYNCSVDSEYEVDFKFQFKKPKDFARLKKIFPDVAAGGTWSSGCNHTEKIALIIPYKDREINLKQFLRNIIAFLQAQRKSFGIFVVEQTGPEIFNKAHIMNAGFLESQKFGNFTCFIFHDVDLVPVNLCNTYTCHPTAIRHLGLSFTPSNPLIACARCIGGASAFTREQFTKINGFSNLFFGWGGEDDDGLWRAYKENLTVLRYPTPVGIYYQLGHEKYGKYFPRVNRWLLVYEHSDYRKHDGLNTVSYKVHNVTKELLFTRVVVSVKGPTSAKNVTKTYIEDINKIRLKMNRSLFDIKKYKPNINIFVH